MSRHKEGLLRARRGAVLAEFAIAFMPICAMFLCLAQLSRYSIARLAVLHAAQVTVRACAVIHDPDPGHSDSLDGPDGDINRAADVAMGPFEGNQWMGEIKHSTPVCNHDGSNDATNHGNGGTDKVTLDATYTCGIPIANTIVCGASKQKTISVFAQFPHQGAQYIPKSQ
jgi:Flp pilus assembly protein TadG